MRLDMRLMQRAGMDDGLDLELAHRPAHEIAISIEPTICVVGAGTGSRPMTYGRRVAVEEQASGRASRRSR